MQQVFYPLSHLSSPDLDFRFRVSILLKKKKIHYIVQAFLEPLILLPPAPVCWDHMNEIEGFCGARVVNLRLHECTAVTVLN